jgi:hypothetical protein
VRAFFMPGEANLNCEQNVNSFRKVREVPYFGPFTWHN